MKTYIVKLNVSFYVTAKSFNKRYDKYNDYE